MLTHIRAPASETELAADVLWQAGASAVVEHDGADDTVTVVGDPTTTIDGLPPHWAVSEHEVVDDGLDGWRPFASAVRAGERIVVQPPWAPGVEPSPGDVVVLIDPGRSFGSGSHPTTRLVLRALEQLVDGSTCVLDVGCGSGVVAIAAARLGAPAVVAVDIDPVAVSATIENAARNDVAVDAGDTPVDAIGPSFDVVVANISAAALAELAPVLTARVRPSGTLVLSGVLDDAVLRAFPEWTLVDRHEEDGWLCFVLASPMAQALSTQ